MMTTIGAQQQCIKVMSDRAEDALKEDVTLTILRIICRFSAWGSYQHDALT
jgi:hypothetical protein